MKASNYSLRAQDLVNPTLESYTSNAGLKSHTLHFDPNINTYLLGVEKIINGNQNKIPLKLC